MVAYPAALEVAVCNLPANQSVSESPPASGDILFGSRATTGTLFTVPAGRVWKGSISLSASIGVAGNAACSVSAATGGLIHQLPLNGLALVVASNANTLDNVYIHGGAGGNVVTFTAGAAGSTAASASGRLL